MRSSILLAASLAVAGCSSNGTVSLTPRPSTKTQALINGSKGESAFTLDRVRLLIDEAELRGGGGGCRHHPGGGGGMGGGGMMGGGQAGAVSFCAHRGHHVEQGPFIVSLTAADLAAGTVSQPVLLADVPAGTYRGAELEIEPLGAEDASARPPPNDGRGGMMGPPPPPRTVDLASLGAEFDDFKTSGASIIIEGTRAGVPFTYSAAITAEQETSGPITVSGGAEVSLGLVIDASTWFTSASGAELDPSDAANHDAIANAIKASLTIEDETGHHHP